MPINFRATALSRVHTMSCITQLVVTYCGPLEHYEDRSQCSLKGIISPAIMAKNFRGCTGYPY